MRYLVVVLMLAGCTTTPREMERGGPPVLEWFSDRPAADVAACIASNGDNLRLGLLGLSSQASMRPGPQPGSYEVSYSNAAWLAFFARILPTNTGGAVARVWRSGSPTFTPYDSGSVEQQLRAGC